MRFRIMVKACDIEQMDEGIAVKSCYLSQTVRYYALISNILHAGRLVLQVTYRM